MYGMRQLHKLMPRAMGSTEHGRRMGDAPAAAATGWVAVAGGGAAEVWGWAAGAAAARGWAVTAVAGWAAGVRGWAAVGRARAGAGGSHHLLGRGEWAGGGMEGEVAVETAVAMAGGAEVRARVGAVRGSGVAARERAAVAVRARVAAAARGCRAGRSMGVC